MQECHPLQQRIHKQHQIKPWQYVLFYSGNTPVGKAIYLVNQALLYRLVYQRAVYMGRPFNFSPVFNVFLRAQKLPRTITKAQEVAHLGKNLLLNKTIALIWDHSRHTPAYIHSELSKGESEPWLCKCHFRERCWIMSWGQL